MWRLILACTLYFGAMVAASVVLAVALAGSAKADTWCASPGPSGEVLYCTDELDQAPAKVLDRMHPFTGTLKDYRKFTPVERYAKLHQWFRPYARERIVRLDSSTWVHDRADGTRAILRRFPDGTLQYDRPAGDTGWQRTPFGWRWEE